MKSSNRSKYTPSVFICMTDLLTSLITVPSWCWGLVARRATSPAAHATQAGPGASAGNRESRTARGDAPGRAGQAPPAVSSTVGS